MYINMSIFLETDIMNITLRGDYKVNIGRGDGPPLTLTLQDLVKFRIEVQTLKQSPMGNATITRDDGTLLRIERRGEREGLWKLSGMLGYWEDIPDQEIADILTVLPEFEKKMFETLAKQAAGQSTWHDLAHNIYDQLESYNKKIYHEFDERDQEIEILEQELDNAKSPESKVNVLKKIFSYFKDKPQAILVLTNIISVLDKIVEASI